MRLSKGCILVAVDQVVHGIVRDADFLGDAGVLLEVLIYILSCKNERTIVVCSSLGVVKVMILT